MEKVIISLLHCLGPTGSATPTPPITVTTTELIPPTTTTEHLETTPTVTRMYFAQEFVAFFHFNFFQYFVYFCHIFAFLNYLLLVCFTCSREGRAQDGNLLHWPQHRLQYPLLLKLSLPIQRLVQPKVQTTIYHFLFLATVLPSITLGFTSLKSDLSNQYDLYFALKLFCTLYLDVRFA